MTSQRPKVVIIGAGFGGLFAANELTGKAVDVLLIDRNNFLVTRQFEGIGQ
jgi:NADH dehydrogenase